MSPENAKKIFIAAQAAGDELKGKLPEDGTHLSGRNSWAHVFRIIKTEMGRPYKECADSDVDHILGIIEHARRNLG